MIERSGDIDIQIIDINEQYRHLLPLNLEPTNSSLKKWLKGRTIPRNRAYVSNLLSRLEMNVKDVKGIIDLCQGLSLSDSYWIIQENKNVRFEKKNLFENLFDTRIASIAFTGYGGYTRSTFRSSPELTTNGMLAKAWRKLDGTIQLYKSGTEGFANAGLEPYSEFYASQVAEAMNIKHVDYELHRWKKRMCSTCVLFTSIDYSFIPAGRLVRKGGIDAVMSYYKELGDEYYQDLIDMLVFDAIILNEDRHFGNFGLIIDNQTNKIISTAPVFDNGLSLLCYAMDKDFEDDHYLNTRRPAAYDDFVEFIKPYMTHRQRQKVRSVLNFQFNKKTRYKLLDKRLKHLEAIIHQQATKLLQ